MGRRRLIRASILGGLALSLVTVAGWWTSRRSTPPSVPEPGLTATTEPEVRADLAVLAEAVRTDSRSASRWGEYAQSLRAYGFHEPADVCFEAAAALDPEDGRWPYLLGSHRAEADAAGAAEWLARAVRAKLPNEVREPARLRWVEALLTAGRVVEARAALGPDPPSSPRAKLAAAGIAAAEGDDRGASVWLAGLAEYPSAARTVLILQADICRRQGRTSYAAVLSERAAAAPNVRWPDPLVDSIHRRNRSRAARMDQAAALLRSGRPFDAEQILFPMSTVENPDPRVLVGLAEARSARGDRAGAAEALAAAMRLDPLNTSANYQVGVHHFEVGERLWHEGKQDAARERFREANGRFDLVLSVSPNFGKAILLKGVALNRFLGQVEEGLTLIRRYIELRPEISEGYLLYGQALADSSREMEAVVTLRRAIETAEPGDRRAADLLNKLTEHQPNRR